MCWLNSTKPTCALGHAFKTVTLQDTAEDQCTDHTPYFILPFLEMAWETEHPPSKVERCACAKGVPHPIELLIYEGPCFTFFQGAGFETRKRRGRWSRGSRWNRGRRSIPRLSTSPRLDTIPDFRAVGREGRCPNVLPDRSKQHYVLEIHETGFVKAERFRPLAQFQKSRVYPLSDSVFTRQEESAQGTWRFQATDGQVADAGETPS